jgi:two-component system phosphate regulon sensor histidine kinase PhoR
VGGAWGTEAWRAFGLLVLAAVLGLAFGYLSLALLAALGFILASVVVKLRRLERWMRTGGSGEPMDATGIWGELYHHHYRLRRRNRRHRQQLSEVLARFNESAAALPDATVVLGENGEIQWVNDAAIRNLGLRRPGDMGHRIDNLIRYPAFIAYLRGEDYSDGLQMPCPEDEDRVLSVTIVPYGDNQKLLVAQDITRLIHLEHVRQDFVANVSHELKTPLTVLAGYLETILNSADAPLGRWKRSLELMQQHTERMKNIVNDLLFLSRLETKRLATSVPVDVPQLIDAISIEAQALSRRAPKPHDIVLDVDETLWLYGDEAELHSAFANLVYNAIHYSPEGGSIRIRWYHQGSTARFSVSDQGVGVPANQIPRLTERFYRVDESRSRRSGGTGLGLSIVKHVLTHHQAEIDIQSEVGRGSTFTCIFPADKLLWRKRNDVIDLGADSADEAVAGGQG